MAWAVGRHARTAVRLRDSQASISHHAHRCLLRATLLPDFKLSALVDMMRRVSADLANDGTSGAPLNIVAVYTYNTPSFSFIRADPDDPGGRSLIDIRLARGLGVAKLTRLCSGFFQAPLFKICTGGTIRQYPEG